MQWLAPAKPKQYLIPVDLEELDFLPPTFLVTAQKHLPFRNYKVATKRLLDSLYYSFGAEYPRINSDLKTATSPSSSYKFYQDPDYDPTPVGDSISCTGIDPNSIKVIKKERFAQTLIATKAFQERIHYLHLAREQAALDIYIQNLDWDMTRCDEKVAQFFR